MSHPGNTKDDSDRQRTEVGRNRCQATRLSSKERDQRDSKRSKGETRAEASHTSYDFEGHRQHF